MSVQRQLREDWDNREYEQIIADNVKNIANFLSSFELSCRSKLASKNNEGRYVELKCRPVSINKDQARQSVLQVYKELQRMTPNFWWDFGMHDMPMGVFRSVLKQQFMKNAHITDLRIIDRLVGETKQHMYAIRYAFYNPDHVRNYLFRENVEAKPKDFLSKFLSGQE
ncbi:hypothetical protein RB195_000474 [Necator americanus]|uniref:NADH dehydrogenase [ubiquinone] 1 alpha subcomplex subunit 6 n=1 Tax=Necator americanus TaxID=51031 RepID=A0ABR1D9X3_NECAM